ncbi:PAS domain-containing protein [Nostoc sp. FACHB-280]|uniref:PAS domain-containing protein n=1 Tax=Nostoc sp. FACHB-280 TaxID=2692839 RepID=UPI00168B2E16|nr:PAS domain-containing protein [Nostoc sp. FACHB-280]MBD2493839.1 PAS domain-containing protein [Nostoc sp. FACHB-280]
MVQARRNVLIVDDSPEDREFYRQCLLRDRHYSYNILEATLGSQGLELWQQQPDVILLDYRLPDLDGLEFLAQLQALSQQSYLPVIMVTGQGSEAIAVQVMKAGAQDYLVKEQITPASLQRAVQGAIETVQLRNQLQQRIERERLLAQIIQKIHQSLDLQEILQTTVTEVRQFLQTDRVVIVRWQPDNSGIVTNESVGAAWTPLLSTCLYDSYFKEYYSEFARQGLISVKPNIYDGSLNSWHIELLANLQVQAKIVVPILQDQQLWGMLIAHHCQAPRQWQPLEIDLLQELAAALGIALRQAELYQQTQHELIERKRIEAELRESKERLHTTLLAARIGTWDWNIQTGLISWSDNLEPLFGLQPGEFDGSFEMFLEQVHPDDRDRILKTVNHVITKGENYEIEFRVVHPNGKIRWALSQGKVFYDQKGQPLRMTGLDIDITERKKSAEALRDSELKFRQLAENIDAVFWIREVLEDRISYVSPAYERLWGLKAQNLYTNQSNWVNLIHPEDKESVARAFQEKAIANQFDEEYRIILPNGSIRWVRDRCFGLKDETGEIYRFTGIAEDITARKQRELNKQFLNQLDLRLRHLQDAQAMMWETVSSLGHYLNVNRCTLGRVDLPQNLYTLEQIWSRNYEDFPRTQTISNFANSEMQAIFATNQALVVHDITKDSRTTAFAQNYAGFQIQAIVCVPCIYQGQLVAVLTVSSPNPRVWSGDDVALLQETVVRIWPLIEQTKTTQALRESEERFRTLADNMSQFAWMADANGWIFWYNQRWFDYTGTTLEEMQGWGWQKVHHPDHLNRVIQHFRHCLTTGEAWEDTFPLRRNDGEYRWFLSRAIPIRDQQGQILRWFGTNTDITEQKQAEEERSLLLEKEQLARAEAERANRIKDEFLAILSHELRSPLNPILGWAKLMQTRKFDATKTTEALATIERNAKLQCQLIDDLLDVAKILRGKLNIDETPINLVFVLEAALDTVRTAAVAKSILLHSTLPQIGQVSGDSARLQQIFWNLLSNAIKFTPAGGRVDVQLQRVDHQAQITISDTGKGIKPDFLPYIFESFCQEDASTTRKYGGLGLGLAIVRYLVEAHGGTIQADSPGEGQGATFTVKLPLLATELRPSQPDELSIPELDLTGIKVLIVDDEPDARELVTAVLAQYGAEILAVTRAAEVLASLESFQPDVLISDIGMPDMDGYTLIQQIRSLPADKGGKIGAIALSAYARKEDQQRSLSVGFQYHISKPLDLDKLVETVSELARKS